MNSDFKKFFSSTLGIVAAILVVLAMCCLCLLALSVIGQMSEPQSFIVPLVVTASM